MKFKWAYPFVPWLWVGVSAAQIESGAIAPSLEIRVLYVVGLAMLSVALLAVIQPWKADRP